MTELKREVNRIGMEVLEQSSLLDQAVENLQVETDKINGEVSTQSALLDQAVESLNTEVRNIDGEVATQANLLDQAMADLETEIGNIDGEVATQSNLLDQAVAALAEKTAAGGDPVIEPLEITENGTYTAPDGVDGYSPVSVNVPIPDGYIQPSGELEVTENGVHDVAEYATINVAIAASGGLPEGVSKIASGLYQPTSDKTTAVDIAHGLGVKPDFCWWVLESDVSAAPMTNTTVVGCYTEKAAIDSNSLKTPYHSHYFMLAYNSSSALQRTASSVEAPAFTATTCRLMANAQYRLKAGCTYRWVCGVLG